MKAQRRDEPPQDHWYYTASLFLCRLTLQQLQRKAPGSELAVTGCWWEFLSKTLTPKTAVARVLNIQLIKDPLSNTHFVQRTEAQTGMGAALLFDI